jgi:Putative bacterial sensory transduction regulator
MNFDTEAQRAAYERAADLMTQMFGEMAWQSSEEPMFGLQLGSAAVNLRVMPLGDDGAFIESWSWVVTGIEQSSELYHYLLGENVNMRFGAFAVDEEGDVMFKYGLIASDLDKEELRAAVLAVGRTADRYDDEIVAKYGGMTAKDRMEAASSQGLTPES